MCAKPWSSSFRCSKPRTLTKNATGASGSHLPCLETGTGRVPVPQFSLRARARQTARPAPLWRRNALSPGRILSDTQAYNPPGPCGLSTAMLVNQWLLAVSQDRHSTPNESLQATGVLRLRRVFRPQALSRQGGGSNPGLTAKFYHSNLLTTCFKNIKTFAFRQPVKMWQFRT